MKKRLSALCLSVGDQTLTSGQELVDVIITMITAYQVIPADESETITKWIVIIEIQMAKQEQSILSISVFGIRDGLAKLVEIEGGAG